MADAVAADVQLDQGGRTEEETNSLIDEANEGSSQASDYLDWEMPAEINQTEYDDLASIMASTLSEEGNSERMSEKCYEALILNFMLRHKANMVTSMYMFELTSQVLMKNLVEVINSQLWPEDHRPAWKSLVKKILLTNLTIHYTKFCVGCKLGITNGTCKNSACSIKGRVTKVFLSFDLEEQLRDILQGIVGESIVHDTRTLCPRVAAVSI